MDEKSTETQPPLLSRNPHKRFIASTLTILVFACVIEIAIYVREPLRFDDAFMFYRYASHLLDGQGLTWNEGGSPTYGLTSVPWVLIVSPFVGLPVAPEIALRLASMLAGSLVLVLLAFGLRRYKPLSFIAVAWIAAMPAFVFHLSTGMDTMLSTLVNAALSISVLRYSIERSNGFALGLLSYTAIAVRPENGLCAFGVPILAWIALTNRDARDLWWLAVFPAALVVGHVLLATSYFGIPLPLSFYVKSLNTYSGFQNAENPVRHFTEAAPIFLPFLVVIGATAKRYNWRIWLPFIVPLALTFAYLATVKQVMGWSGRFYVPFTPFMLVPAVALAAQTQVTKAKIAMTLTIAFTFVAAGVITANRLDQLYNSTFISPPIDEPKFGHRTKPIDDWWKINKAFGDDVIRRLPAGYVVAASEVGYIGVAGPEIRIIDLVGLNDTEIGRHGFSMDYLLSLKPNLIWLPHSDYTGLRAAILSDPRFLRDYLYYPEAYNYGLAVRRDSATQQTMASIRERTTDSSHFDTVVESHG